MKNFFLNIISSLIAFVLISLGVYAVEERRKTIMEAIEFEKKQKKELELLKKRYKNKEL